jgi:CRISPR-associated protein Csh2
MSLDKNYNALVVVRAKNALFNAGFDGMPRMLPSGQIFATDKAFKYCIKEYLRLFKDQKIFVSRNRHLVKNKYVYDTLEDNYKNKLNKDKIPTNDEVLLDDLRSFIDVRLFGVVFSAQKGSNISITGPVQINYGIDQLEGSGKVVTSSILSPYADKKTNNKNIQTTIGNQTRSSEVYYVYDISINKSNSLFSKMNLEDLNLLKDSLKYSVNAITSTSKFGCDIVSTLFFENKDGKIYNNLNNLVKINKDSKGIVNIDYTAVLKHINLNKDSDKLEYYIIDKDLFKIKLDSE